MLGFVLKAHHMPTTANTPPPGNATPPPTHMTGAELQTLREAAGLSREALAELVGVQARTVKHWESGRAGVPADVAAMAHHWAQWTRQTAQAMHQAAREWLRQFEPVQVHHLGDPEPRTLAATAPGPVVMVRHQQTEDMHRAERARGARADCHGAAVAQAVQRLALDGVAARVVWFDAASFASWCQANSADDTPAARTAWAQAAALPAQAIPPRGDQPPADFAPGYGMPSTGAAQGRSRP